MPIKLVKNRDGDMVAFDPKRIKIAVLKAFVATKSLEAVDPKKPTTVPEDLDAHIDQIVAEVIVSLRKLHEKEEVVGLEHIQDEVERQLMAFKEFDVAKQYILYRQEHIKARNAKKHNDEQKLHEHKLTLIKHNGQIQVYDQKKVRATYDIVAQELAAICPFEDFVEKVELYIADEMKSSEMYKVMFKAAVDLISIENIQWQFIAGRILSVELYKLAQRERKIAINDLYGPESFATLIEEYVRDGRFYKDFFEHYSRADFLEAGKHIDQSIDFTYGCTTMLMLKKRYLLNPNKIVKELPQHMYMGVAMFLAVPEPKETRLQYAIALYKIIATQKLSLATPCLMNSRRRFHQLSSCFKLAVDDDLRAIYHNIENIAQISKFGGGVGTYLGHIRSKGGTIRGVKGVSGGVVPRVKVINDTAIAVNQLGARAGAVSVTLDCRHRDIFDRLHMQTETGDMRRKCFDIFPSMSVCDLFMERVEQGGQWTLFDPYEVKSVTGKRLENYFNDEFREFYEICEKDERLELREVISAKELFKTFLKTVVETGMPYVFFRDTVNRYNPNRHCGNIYSTQLCTEIAQNTSSSTFEEEAIEGNNVVLKYKMGDTVVCNLASINVAAVHSQEDMQHIIPIAMRALDNVITMNLYPIKESEVTSMKYRSVGLGFLGVAEHLAVNKKLMYESSEAREHIDELFESYAYHVMRSSVDLAKERGHYELCPGSDRSKGIIMGKDDNRFASHSKTSHDWKGLISDMKNHGVRFSYHTAPAPNTSTANVVNTTAGVLPVYKKYYVYTDAVAPSVNVAPKMTPENQRYYKEYVHMKMPAVIDMVAVIQKWIDQAISFEWLFNPADTTPKDLYDYYMQGWKSGLKTVYYVRSMSLDVKECVSCSG